MNLDDFFSNTTAFAHLRQSHSCLGPTAALVSVHKHHSLPLMATIAENNDISFYSTNVPKVIGLLFDFKSSPPKLMICWALFLA
jgi:hypothetical protein